MVPFKLPLWKKEQIDKTFQRKNMVINKAVHGFEKVMKDGVDYIMYHGIRTGQWYAPSLNELFNISETFYRDVITQAFYSCEDEKKSQKVPQKSKDVPHGTKKLAKGKWPFGIPKDLTGLEKIFRDKRRWPLIMKRSVAIVNRVRTQYLGLLQKKFQILVPQFRSGEVTPDQVKEELMKVWQARKARVELIFRTETSTYFGKTQVAFYNSDPDIIGFLFDSVRDTGRTEICRARHGLIFTKEHKGELSLSRNTPALHYNCRSHLIALANTKENVMMLRDDARNPYAQRAKLAKADSLERKIRF
jgi:SPP1 gp7 family putative phage head morphogenesis protein